MRALFAICVLTVPVTGVAEAKPQPWPLTTLPADKLVTLAPSLRDQDLALIESDARGMLKQITTVTLVAAPAALVHEIVVAPRALRPVRAQHVALRRAPRAGRHDRARLQARLHRRQRRRAPSLRVCCRRWRGRRRRRSTSTIPTTTARATIAGSSTTAPGGGTLVVMYGYSQIPHRRDLRQADEARADARVRPGADSADDAAARGQGSAPSSSRPGSRARRRRGRSRASSFLLDRGTLALFRRAADARVGGEPGRSHARAARRAGARGGEPVAVVAVRADDLEVDARWRRARGCRRWRWSSRCR